MIDMCFVKVHREVEKPVNVVNKQRSRFVRLCAVKVYPLELLLSFQIYCLCSTSRHHQGCFVQAGLCKYCKICVVELFVVIMYRLRKMLCM
jgi:hypothetical protein